MSPYEKNTEIQIRLICKEIMELAVDIGEQDNRDPYVVCCGLLLAARSMCAVMEHGSGDQYTWELFNDALEEHWPDVWARLKRNLK